MSMNEDPELPAAFEIVSEVEVVGDIFPNGTADMTTPFGAAVLWIEAIADPEKYAVALENLSIDATAWGDFSEAKAELSDRAMTTRFHECEGSKGGIGSIKFIPDNGHNMRAFEDVVLRDVKILTLIREPDGLWRVWGLSQHIPIYEEVVRV